MTLKRLKRPPGNHSIGRMNIRAIVDKIQKTPRGTWFVLTVATPIKARSVGSNLRVHYGLFATTKDKRVYIQNTSKVKPEGVKKRRPHVETE